MLNELTLNAELRALKTQYIALDKQFKNLLFRYNNIEKEITSIKQFIIQNNRANKQLSKRMMSNKSGE